MEHTSSYPWIFLARAPPACPRSSFTSAQLRAVPVNFLPPYSLSPQLRLHRRLYVKPYLAPHYSLFAHSPTVVLKPRLPRPFLSTRLPFLLTTQAAPNRGRKLGDPSVPLPVPASELGSTGDSNLYRHCDLNNTYLQNSCEPQTFRVP